MYHPDPTSLPRILFLALLFLSCGDDRPPASAPPPPPPPGDALVPPGSNPAQAAAIRAVARIRTAAKLPPIPGSTAIHRASQSHADYLIMNPEQIERGLSAHEQVRGTPGFTGVQFSDRMAAAGYTGRPYSEIIHFVGDPEDAVAGWENSVFHRIPLISWSAGELGFGEAESDGQAVDVMDFGLTRGAADWNAIVFYPPEAAADVPRSFNGFELPRPTMPPGGWPSGPLISVVFESPDFTVTTHEIALAGAQVPHVEITPDTPDVGYYMDSSVCYYPYDPPPSGSSVTAHVVGTINGLGFDKTWSFRVK